jgi:Inner membrane component of T3SS, cytoplasmic domain/Inner membrane component of T3SS, periplasmic domain
MTVPAVGWQRNAARRFSALAIGPGVWGWAGDDRGARRSLPALTSAISTLTLALPQRLAQSQQVLHHGLAAVATQVGQTTTAVWSRTARARSATARVGWELGRVAGAWRGLVPVAVAMVSKLHRTSALAGARGVVALNRARADGAGAITAMSRSAQRLMAMRTPVGFAWGAATRARSAAFEIGEELTRGVGAVGTAIIAAGRGAIVATRSFASAGRAKLREGVWRARGSVGGSWIRAASVTRSFVSMVTEEGRCMRLSLARASKQVLLVAGSLGSAGTRKLHRGASRARRSATVAWSKIASAVRSSASTVMAGLRRGAKGLRANAGRAWDRSTGAIRSSIASVTTALRRGVRGARARVAATRHPRTPPLEGVVFEVIRGLHDGVRVMLESGVYRIGSTAEADIVLRDAGVVPGHAVLGVQRGNVRLEAIGDNVGIGSQTVLKGHGCRLRLPLEFSIGEACLRLSHVEPQSRGRSPWTVTGLAVGSVCVIALLALGFLREEGKARVELAPPSTPTTRLASSDPAAGLAALARSEREQVADPHTLERAQQEVAAHLRDAKIHMLRVNVEDGRLTVSGILLAHERAKWSEIQYWFDQTYRGRVGLTANFTENKPPNLQLRAVWFGDRPYVITADGQHFNQGAVLDDGWIVQEIAQDHLLLAKDGDTESFSYP